MYPRHRMWLLFSITVSVNNDLLHEQTQQAYNRRSQATMNKHASKHLNLTCTRVRFD